MLLMHDIDVTSSDWQIGIPKLIMKRFSSSLHLVFTGTC